MIKINQKKVIGAALIIFMTITLALEKPAFFSLNLEGAKNPPEQLKKEQRTAKNDEAKGNVETDKFIVKCSDENKLKNFLSELKDDIKSSKENKDKKYSVITTKDKKKINDFKQQLSKNKLDSDIEYIQPDYPVKLSSDDTEFREQWGISKVASDADKVQVDANVVHAWDKSDGAGVVVAVLDTGIDITHQDLAENIFINKGEIPDNGKDDDGDGLIDDVNGWNFFGDDNVVHDAVKESDEWHGTHVAGIIAAVKDNKTGIAGVAPRATILPLKVFENGAAYTSDIIEAIEYAEKMGAKIVNCSWGNIEDNQALEEAIQKASMLFVCASGNNSSDIDFNPVYPAAFSENNIISVASVNKDGFLSEFSDFGEGSVDVAAPGKDIISTFPENKYGKLSGTSMSAAFVSGEAALIYSKNKNYSAEAIREGIIKSSDRISTLLGKVYRANLINASNGVNGITTDDSKINKIEIIKEPQNNDTKAESSSGYQLFSDTQWLSKTSMPTPRCGLGVVALNGKVYAMGGFNGTSSNKVEVYDPNTDTWTTKANMPVARAFFGIAALDNRIYVIGGNNNCGNRVDEYDPATDTWTNKANMPTSRTGLGAAAVNGKIYAVGGEINAVYTNAVEEYDPSSNTWTRKADMLNAKSSFGIATANNKIYVAGGTSNIGYLNDLAIYDPSTNVWNIGESMSKTRGNLAAIAAGNQIYAIGGYSKRYLQGDYVGQIYNTVEKYDIPSNTWRTANSLVNERQNLAATNVNGKILDIGGENTVTALGSVEYIDIPGVFDDYGNDFASAFSINLDTLAPANIDYAGDVDFFKFTPTMSGSYTIRSIGTTDTYGYLYDSSQKLIISNDDAVDRNFSITANLTAGQTYYIKVNHFDSSSTGAYELQVVKNDLEGDDFNTTNVITTGNLYNAAIDYPGDIDMFKIVPNVSGAYAFQTSGSTDTYGYLYDSNQISLAQNDDTNGTNFYIKYNLTAGRTYYVKVRHYSSSAEGSYTLSVVRDDTEGNDFTTATVINLGNWIQGSIDIPGDLDYFTFTPKVTGRYSLENNILTDATGTLYDSNKAQLASGSGNSSSQGFYFTYNLTANQKYYLKVQRSSSVRCGDYGILITQISTFKINKSDFTLSISGLNINSFKNRYVIVTYNPNELDVVDLCGFTPQLEKTTGKITGTNLEITTFAAGTIKFRVNNDFGSGKVWTGVINSIKFISKVNYETQISYTIR